MPMRNLKDAEKLAAQKKKLFADLARATHVKIRKNPPQIVESYMKRTTKKKKKPWPSAVKDAYFITKAKYEDNTPFGEVTSRHPGIENRNGRFEIQHSGPADVILPILKKYQGQSIRIVLLAPFELGKIKPSSSPENHAAYDRDRQDILDSKFAIGSGTYYKTQWIEEEEGGGFVDYGRR